MISITDWVIRGHGGLHHGTSAQCKLTVLQRRRHYRKIVQIDFHTFILITVSQTVALTGKRPATCLRFVSTFFVSRLASHPHHFCVREATNQQTTPHSGLPYILNPGPLINRDLPLFVRSAELSFSSFFSSGCNWGIPKSRLWVCLTACGQPLFKHSPASAALVCNCG